MRFWKVQKLAVLPDLGGVLQSSEHRFAGERLARLVDGSKRRIVPERVAVDEFFAAERQTENALAKQTDAKSTLFFGARLVIPQRRST